MRYFSSALTVMGLSLVVSACAIGDPTPIPRGYASYLETYKSAPGADARPIGYDYSIEKNNTVIEDMRFAAIDLVEKLDQKLSFAKDKIYLTPPPNSAFYNSFDLLLRDELIKRGYIISSLPDDAVTLTFVAKEPADNNKAKIPSESQPAKSVYRELYLALAVTLKENVPQEEVGGLYEIPTYDFKSLSSITTNQTEQCQDAGCNIPETGAHP